MTASPDSVRRTIQRGLKSQRRGDLALAEKRYRAALDSEPDNVDALHLLGLVRHHQGRPDEAVALIGRATAIDPRFAEARANLGHALLAAGQPQKAAAAYEAALTLRPDLVDACIGLGQARHACGDIAGARQCFEQVLAADRGNLRALTGLGRLHQDTADFDAAERLFRAARAADPGNPQRLIDHGNALYSLARFGDAEDAFRAAARRAPTFKQAHLNLGLALRMQDRQGDAERAFRAAIALDADYAEAHMNLGNALRSLERHDEAIDHLDRAAALDPNSAEARCFLGAAHLETGDAATALVALDACLQLAPKNRSALAYRGVALPMAGREAEAARLLDYDRLIQPADLAPPAGFDDLDAFNGALVEHVLAHPSLAYERTGNATRNGRHTGNLLSGDRGPVALLEQRLREQIDAYFDTHPPAPDHPFLCGRPTHWRMTMWAVVMETRGHQLPHIHPAAWLSGVYYARLPAIIDETTADRQGWIEFGRPPSTIPADGRFETRLFRPAEGRCFLFPSYFYHGTVPFETDEMRVSIAFDVVPDLAFEQGYL